MLYGNGVVEMYSLRGNFVWGILYFFIIYFEINNMKYI